MIQSLDFVLWVQKHPNDKEKIMEAFSSEEHSEIVVDRHRLSFDPMARSVTVDRASEDVMFACKIIKCRMPYGLLQKVPDGDWDDLTGLEYL